MSTGFAPLDFELQLMTAMNARRQALADEQKQNAAQPQQTAWFAAMLSKWADHAPQLPPTIAVPLAKSGVDPASDLGRSIVQTHYGLQGDTNYANALAAAPEHRQGLIAHDPSNLSDVPSEELQPTPASNEPVKSEGFSLGGLAHAVGTGLGDIGKATVTGASAAAGLASRAVSGTYADIGNIDRSQHIPNATPVANTAVRFGAAALQAPYEAMQTGLSAPIPGLPGINGQQQDGAQNLSQLTDPNQFTLTQMIKGKDSGQGLFPNGAATAAARATQAQVRGTVGGHVSTPGRVFASRIVEPGTEPFTIVSGLTDFAIANKFDPSAHALSEISDAIKARQIFDVTGAAEGARKFVYGPNFDTWSQSKPASQVFDALANMDTTRGVRKAIKVPVDLAAQIADSHDPAQIRDLLGARVAAGDVTHVPGPGFGWSRPLEDLRWASQMPANRIDITDLNDAADQVERMMVTAKADPAKIDAVIHDIGMAKNRTDLFDAVVNKAGDAMAEKLVSDYNISPIRAKHLTRFFQDDTEAARRYFVDEVGNTPHLPGMTVDGEAVPLDGPHLPSELLNQSIPLPNARRLRSAANSFNAVLRSDVVQDMPLLGSAARGEQRVAQGLSLVANAYTNIFRMGVHARLALTARILGDTQARMAGSGLDSMFSHPIDYIAWLIGRKGDAASVDFNNVVNEVPGLDQYSKLMGHGTDSFGADKMRIKGFDLFNRQSENYTHAWADELSHLHMDPVGGQVAKAMVEGNGLDATKEAFWNDPFRQQMVDAGGWRGLLDSRQGSDAYIESVAQRIADKTGEHPDLLNAVATGDFGRQNRITQKFLRQLGDLQEEGIGPDVVRGKKLETVAGSTGILGNFGGALDHAADKMFQTLIDKPVGALSKSPTFKQYYWQEIERLLPAMPAADQEKLLENARFVGLGGKIEGNLEAAVRRGTGEIPLAHADLLAKSSALKQTQDLFGNFARKNQSLDALRTILPFGEIWKNEAKTWSSLAASNPQILRRGQQLMGAARNTGFFYKDPTDGKEYFTIVPGGITKKVVGVPFPIRAQVSGLNIIGQGLPAVGPALQIPLAKLIPNTPQWQSVRQNILPFGDPDQNGGLLDQLLPGWMHKMQTGNWLDQIPVVGTVAKLGLSEAAPQSPNQQRVFSNTVKDVMAYLVSSGAYDTSNSEDNAKLVADATHKAEKLYALTSAAQFVSPAAPSALNMVNTKNEGLLEFSVMASDYHKMQDKDRRDGTRLATQSFIEKYGQRAFLVMEPQGQRTVYGAPTTQEATWWASKHQTFVKAYDGVQGFFAPQGGKSDYQAYLNAIDNKQVAPLSPQDWLQLANSRVAAAVYANQRSKFPASLDAAQSGWLANYKANLVKQFPGYQPDQLLSHQKYTTPTLIDQFRGAIENPAVKDTALAGSIRTYLKARDEAVAAIHAKFGAQASLDRKDAAGVRAWLRAGAAQLAQQDPAFQAAWDYVFSNEAGE